MKPLPAVASKSLALCVLLPLAACAGQGQERQHAPAATAAPAAAQEQVVEAELAWRGTVTAVDAGARLVTLDTADGQRRSFRIDEQVQRLDRVQVGDRVEILFQRSLVFDMQPAGSVEPGAYIWEDEQHPDPDRPGIVEREVVVVLSPLVAVDTAANTISVQAPDGRVHVLDVEQPRHRESLDRLNVGDLLRIQFRRLLAVRVVPEE